MHGQPALATHRKGSHMTTVKDADVTVKLFDEEKKFGFFVTNAGEEVFVHLGILHRHGFTSLDMKVGAPATIDYEINKGNGRAPFIVSELHHLGGKLSRSKGRRSGKMKRPAIMRGYAIGEDVTGVIKELSPNKDWGFLRVDGRKNLFFHISAFPALTTQHHLAEGRVIQAVVGEGRKGGVAAVKATFVEDDTVVDFKRRRRASG